MANHHRHTRRSTMSHSSTRCSGMDVHQDASAVAYVAQDPGAAVLYRGAIGTRPFDSDLRIRQLPSNATPLIFVSEAGPWGSWLSRYLRTQGDEGWVVAPSLIPHKPGARVKTARRDAGHLARLARSGDRPA